eukprot:GEMP01073829.1.p1 GENE.GEMP01073829.1~~GEMP01073829.1.p1  ORF type:complete len:307 (+),score=75.04 GEMP01073829.1:170-1090(+)
MNSAENESHDQGETRVIFFDHHQANAVKFLRLVPLLNIHERVLVAQSIIQRRPVVFRALANAPLPKRAILLPAVPDLPRPTALVHRCISLGHQLPDVMLVGALTLHFCAHAALFTAVKRVNGALRHKECGGNRDITLDGDSGTFCVPYDPDMRLRTVAAASKLEPDPSPIRATPAARQIPDLITNYPPTPHNVAVAASYDVELNKAYDFIRTALKDELARSRARGEQLAEEGQDLLAPRTCTLAVDKENKRQVVGSRGWEHPGYHLYTNDFLHMCKNLWITKTHVRVCPISKMIRFFGRHILFQHD